MARLRDMEKGDLFGGKAGKKGAAAAQQAVNTEALNDELEQMEKDINELKAQYELYFMGVERNEPRVQRDLIRSQLRRIKEIKHNNTQVKFKYQMLQARMVSLDTYWGRVLRQREEGTYKRDMDKVKRREAELAEQAKKKGLKPGEKPAELGKDGKPLPAAAPTADRAASATGLAPAAARPAATSASDLTDGTLRTLYSTYVTAKRRCGEQVDLKFDEMASSLRKQVPKLMQSTGAKAIEFKVVIKGGHAVLKAVPKT